MAPGCKSKEKTLTCLIQTGKGFSLDWEWLYFGSAEGGTHTYGGILGPRGEGEGIYTYAFIALLEMSAALSVL